MTVRPQPTSYNYSMSNGAEVKSNSIRVSRFGATAPKVAHAAASPVNHGLMTRKSRARTGRRRYGKIRRIGQPPLSRGGGLARLSTLRYTTSARMPASRSATSGSKTSRAPTLCAAPYSSRNKTANGSRPAPARSHTPTIEPISFSPQRHGDAEKKKSGTVTDRPRDANAPLPVIRILFPLSLPRSSLRLCASAVNLNLRRHIDWSTSASSVIYSGRRRRQRSSARVRSMKRGRRATIRSA